jgi:hypothetical protein
MDQTGIGALTTTGAVLQADKVEDKTISKQLAITIRRWINEYALFTIRLPTLESLDKSTWDDLLEYGLPTSAAFQQALAG